MSRYAFIQFAFIMFSCGWSSLQNKFKSLTFLFIPCRQKINKTNFLSKRNIIHMKMPIGSYYGKEKSLKALECNEQNNLNSSFHSICFIFQLCSYYVDPQNCLGPVAASPVAGSREFTAGEKRLASHPDFLHFNQIQMSLCLVKTFRRMLLEITMQIRESTNKYSNN